MSIFSWSPSLDVGSVEEHDSNEILMSHFFIFKYIINLTNQFGANAHFLSILSFHFLYPSIFSFLLFLYLSILLILPLKPSVFSYLPAFFLLSLFLPPSWPFLSCLFFITLFSHLKQVLHSYYIYMYSNSLIDIMKAINYNF